MPRERIGLTNLEKTGDAEMVARGRLALDSLDKEGVDLANIEIETIILKDISSSMDDEYEDGSVEGIMRCSLAYSGTVDKDSTLQVVDFGLRTHDSPAIDLKNYQSYFGGRRTVMGFGRRTQWWPQTEPGTRMGAGMAHVMRVVGAQLDNPNISELSERDPDPNKSYAAHKVAHVIVLTDGQTADGWLAEQIGSRSTKTPTFWSHLYCSNQSGGEALLRKLARPNGGLPVANANASFFPNIRAVNGVDFYGSITRGFGQWVHYVSQTTPRILLPAA